MYDDDIQQDPSCEIVLPPTFFSDLTQLEKQYSTKRDIPTMQLLLCYYTDCVSYFSLKQERVSQYFQAKIQQISKEIVIRGSPQKLQENKIKMNKKVMSFMAEENISAQISEQIEKEEKITKKVNNIIEQQERKLMERRQRSKRSLNKSQSVTFSFGSLKTSPDLERQKIKNLTSQKFLFQKQINSSDEEEQLNSN